jgi:hypothetical protein
MDRDNPTGADNQQETESVLALEAWWVVGFIDGEGCFSVSIHRNRGAPHGGQLLPAFHAYQHRDHAHVLEELQRFFGCGVIRPKGPSSSVLTYSVQHRRELLGVVIPFFERHTLVVKGADFASFRTIVRSLVAKEHLEREGFERLVRLAYGMNGRGKQRSRSIQDVLGILRDCTPGPRDSGVKIQSDPYGDMWSQAEMT